ncbi:hypothetical protein PMIN06_011646 [Paraphaeosphaeria minitans]
MLGYISQRRLAPQWNTPPAASEYSEFAVDLETTEGRMLFDPDGNMRYLGETSGATFLDLLKAFMLTLVPLAFVPDPGSIIPKDGSTFVAPLGCLSRAIPDF